MSGLQLPCRAEGEGRRRLPSPGTLRSCTGLPPHHWRVKHPHRALCPRGHPPSPAHGLGRPQQPSPERFPTCHMKFYLSLVLSVMRGASPPCFSSWLHLLPFLELFGPGVCGCHLSAGEVRSGFWSRKGWWLTTATSVSLWLPSLQTRSQLLRAVLYRCVQGEGRADTSREQCEESDPATRQLLVFQELWALGSP